MVYHDRYIRQINLPGFGQESQQRLQASKVLIIGLGGLGVPVVQYLTSMGVGLLGLADGDTVQVHNLQRQPLYHESDLGRPKVDCAGEFVARQNSQVKVRFHPHFLSPDNALELIKDYDLVVDASDNFGTRYLVNDACVLLGKPFIYGGLYGFEGQVSVMNYKHGPTYRCLFPTSPAQSSIPDCNERGVLGILPGIIGSLQGLEAVKVLCELGKPLSGELLIFDGMEMDFRKMKFRKQKPGVTRLEQTYDIPCLSAPEIDRQKFMNEIRDVFLLDVRDIEEYEEEHLPNSKHIPLKDLREKLDLLPDKKTYVLCKTGRRSAQAVQILKQAFPDRQYRSLKDGLDGLRPLQELSTKKVTS